MATSLIHDPKAGSPLRAALALLCLPALLAGCLAGEPAQPKAPTGQIDGAVVDQLLRPFANQTVHLVQLGRTDQTSPLGGFTFRDVPVGFYTLTTAGDEGRFASQVVDVQEGRITRTILQLLPVPGPQVGILPYAHQSRADQAEAGALCEPCGWSLMLPAQRPAEVTLEAVWDMGLVGKDMARLDITVSDDRGFPLLKANDVSSPVRLSIAGEDLHPEARELRVAVHYGSSFLPDPDFTMRSVLTLYLGATKADLLGVPA